MAKIRNEIFINKPSNKVWEVLKNFGDNHRWSNNLSDSRIDGEHRVCTLSKDSPAPGAILKEKLLSLNDQMMRLEYSVTDAPFPVEFHNALIDVYPEQNGSTVTWTTNVVPDELAAMFSPVFDADLNQLKTLVEKS